MARLLTIHTTQELGNRFIEIITDIHYIFSTISNIDVDSLHYSTEEGVLLVHSQTDPNMGDEDEDPFPSMTADKKGNAYDRDKNAEDSGHGP